MRKNKYPKIFFVLILMTLFILTEDRKLQAMNQINSNPMTPTSIRVLDDSELKMVVIKIVRELEKLKKKYTHLNNFNQESAIFRSSLIWYKNNIKNIPNPEYEKEILERKNKEPLKRPLPPEQIQIYPKKDGIELYIEFTDVETFKMSQRMWQPELWIGNYAVELKVDGAATQDIQEIKEKVKQILIQIKKSVEK